MTSSHLPAALFIAVLASRATSLADQPLPAGGAVLADRIIAAQSPDDDYYAPSSYSRGQMTQASCAGDACGSDRSSTFGGIHGVIQSATFDRSWDNGYFFLLGEAFRLTDRPTRAAARAGVNWALPIVNDGSGLGFQLGFSGSWAEEAPQWFVTSGLFYRGDMRKDCAWNFGAAIDFAQDDELHSDVAQVRGMTSITFDRQNEIGAWAAGSLLDDQFGNHTIQSVDQVNGFYRHLCESGTEWTTWAGWRTDPSSFALGMSTYTPITDRWAGVFGAYYAFHGDTWNVYTGLVWHWCERARVDYLGQDRHQPYFPVADNTSMTLFEKR